MASSGVLCMIVPEPQVHDPLFKPEKLSDGVEAALRKLGANFSEAKSGGLLVELPTQTSDDALIKEVPLLERLNVVHLYLPQSNCHGSSIQCGCDAARRLGSDVAS
jgi:hypothetical protein